MPVPSALVDGLVEEDAYAIQRAYVTLRLQDDTIAGYKVGATVAAARRAMGLENPLTGVLPASGAHESGSEVRLSAFTRLLIETEVGFRAVAAVDAPVENDEALQRIFAECFPVCELAEIGYYGIARTTGVDLIAANAACSGFVQGTAVPSAELDVDALTVTLHRDDEKVYDASSTSTLGGSPWRSLHWLVNTMIGQGYRVEPGQIFLTGALGQPQPGAPGRYRADYGPLGTVSFTLV